MEDEHVLVPLADLNDGTEAMEVVGLGETLSTAQSQPVDDPQSGRFTWRVENFSNVNVRKHYSDIFVVGGCQWRVLLFPTGTYGGHVSVYLDVADSATLAYGWSRLAHFSLSVINQLNPGATKKDDTQHQFNGRQKSWGFASLLPLQELHDPSRGFLVNDTLILEVDVNVWKVVDYSAYDSKKETGFVGLKNQGPTNYMSSLLQTLYHLPFFRKIVYRIPTTEDDVPSHSIPLALQSLFYRMHYTETSVATNIFMKSLQWDSHDSYLENDVQELNRVLRESLEDKMKDTVVEGAIQQLFEGRLLTYTECINVDHKSIWKESFYDLQLDVKGCKNVYESFDKYVEVEKLEGDNKYHAEHHGLQDARKGVLFMEFPPVLQLHVTRFEYDFMRGIRVKVNDRYEFPLQLDMDKFNRKYLSPEADHNVRNLYSLYSVLAHSGGGHGGDYYAFIRPTLADQWYKFDDERVTEEEVKRAVEEQYGGEELPQANPVFSNTPSTLTKCSSAYMLVYIRECDKDKVFCNVEKVTTEHLQVRLKEQQEKKRKRKENAKAHLHTVIKVARDDDLMKQIGKDFHFDLVNHSKVRSFRVEKQTLFTQFKEEVAKKLDIPIVCQRFWLWTKRRNETYRPSRPVNEQEELQTVGHLKEASNNAPNAELKLFLEVPIPFLGQKIRAAPSQKTEEDILLFFKLYNPEKEELRYVGRTFVKLRGKPTDILHTLNHMAGFAPNDEINLYEEITFDPYVMCKPIGKKSTFKASQLQDGDIICYQKALDKEDLNYRYPHLPSFLEYIRDRQNRHCVEQRVKIQS